jgi:hypothetical protein
MRVNSFPAVVFVVGVVPGALVPDAVCRTAGLPAVQRVGRASEPRCAGQHGGRGERSRALRRWAEPLLQPQSQADWVGRGPGEVVVGRSDINSYCVFQTGGAALVYELVEARTSTMRRRIAAFCSGQVIVT